MAIVNAGVLPVYDDIEPELRARVRKARRLLPPAHPRGDRSAARRRGCRRAARPGRPGFPAGAYLMHVLITRPEPDAGALKAQIEAMGHAVSLEPLLQIELLPIAADALAGAQGLVAPRRNGFRAAGRGGG